MSFLFGSAPKPPDPYAVSAAQTQSNKDTAAYEASLNRVNQVTPFGSSTWNGTGPGATQTVSLAPQAQQNLDNQLKQDSQLSQLGFGLADRAGQSLQGQVDTSKLPGLYGSLDLSGAPKVATDFGAQTRQAQNAVYGQATSRLDPMFHNEQNDLDAKLANQGIVQGSEAWQRAQDQEGRNRNDAYNQAAYSAIGAGNALQNQQFGQSLDARNQAVGEALQQGNFGNQSRAQGLQEQTQMQMLPLNELNALRSQSQVQTPTFSQVPQTTIAPTNVSGNVWQGYNAQAANYNNMMNGLFGLAGAGLSAAKFSDRRLKRRVKRIGKTLGGLAVYEFEYLWSRAKQIGVMAQEALRTQPEAVMVHPSGYLMVDYGKVR